MTKPVSLAAHKNTLAKRRSKQLQAMLRNHVDLLAEQIDGFALVTWGADGEARRVTYEAGKAFPASLLGEFVKRALNQSHDAETIRHDPPWPKDA